jgi:hypothetical protein
MSDNYQAVYDAVRSRFGHVDVARAIQDGMSMDASFAIESVRNEFLIAAGQMTKPSVLYRPSLTLDGTMWCALYGEDLMNGVAGFGETPAEAMDAFDKAWATERTPAAIRAASDTRGEADHA